MLDDLVFGLLREWGETFVEKLLKPFESFEETNSPQPLLSFGVAVLAIDSYFNVVEVEIHFVLEIGEPFLEVI